MSHDVSTKDTVFAAVRELRALEQIATRERVRDVTNLRQTIVDDRLRELADEGVLRRLARGVYEVVATFPPARIMSCTELDDGRVKLDIGDDVLTLTPAEARKLARGLTGFTRDLLAIEANRQVSDLIDRIHAEVIGVVAKHTAREGGAAP